MITRGIKAEIDEFIKQLQGKYMPFKWRDMVKGEKELSNHYVQLSIRPIELWEIVFPEDMKDVILTTCLGKDYKGKPQSSRISKFVWALRKMLGAKEIPKFDTANCMPIRCEGIERIGIGIRPDKWVDKDGKTIDDKQDGAFEAL